MAVTRGQQASSTTGSPGASSSSSSSKNNTKEDEAVLPASSTTSAYSSAGVAETKTPNANDDRASTNNRFHGYGCPSCGHNVGFNAKRCRTCGAPVLYSPTTNTASCGGAAARQPPCASAQQQQPSQMMIISKPEAATSKEGTIYTVEKDRDDDKTRQAAAARDAEAFLEVHRPSSNDVPLTIDTDPSRTTQTTTQPLAQSSSHTTTMKTNGCFVASSHQQQQQQQQQQSCGAPLSTRAQLTPIETLRPVEVCAHVNALRCEPLHRALRQLVHRLMTHPLNHGWFNHPVDPVALNLPDYFDIVEKPMDLGTIKSRLSNFEYSDVESFADDVRLVFKNALRYNPPKNAVHHAASEMAKDFETDVERAVERARKASLKVDEHECGLCQGKQCVLCGDKCLTFETPALMCSGPCSQKVRRDQHYHVTRDGSRLWCHKCYLGLKSVIPPPPEMYGYSAFTDAAPVVPTASSSQRECAASNGGSSSTTDDAEAAQTQQPSVVSSGVGTAPQVGLWYKRDLIKRKFDEDVAEPWVQCDACARWVHQTCALFNAKAEADASETQRFVCPLCELQAFATASNTPVGSTSCSSSTNSSFENNDHASEGASSSSSESSSLVDRAEGDAPAEKETLPKEKSPTTKPLKLAALTASSIALVEDESAECYKPPAPTRWPKSRDDAAVCAASKRSGSSSPPRSTRTSEIDLKLNKADATWHSAAVERLSDDETDDYATPRRVVDLRLLVGNPDAAAAAAAKAGGDDHREQQKVLQSSDCASCLKQQQQMHQREDIPSRPAQQQKKKWWSARALRKTKMSDHLEEAVKRRMRAKGDAMTAKAADTICVRVLSAVPQSLRVPPVLRANFQNPGGGPLPEVLPFESRAVALFQRNDGVDLCVFAMYVHEFSDAGAEGPSAKRVYLAYLDSVEYFRPRTARTFVYHELLAAYLDWSRKRGFRAAHIWACPPQRGNNFIFWCHPPHQRTPSRDRLGEWYRAMIARATRVGAVSRVQTLYDDYFAKLDEHRLWSRRRSHGGAQGTTAGTSLSSSSERGGKRAKPSTSSSSTKATVIKAPLCRGTSSSTLGSSCSVAPLVMTAPKVRRVDSLLSVDESVSVGEALAPLETPGGTMEDRAFACPPTPESASLPCDAAAAMRSTNAGSTRRRQGHEEDHDGGDAEDDDEDEYGERLRLLRKRSRSTVSDLMDEASRAEAGDSVPHHPPDETNNNNNDEAAAPAAPTVVHQRQTTRSSSFHQTGGLPECPPLFDGDYWPEEACRLRGLIERRKGLFSSTRLASGATGQFGGGALPNAIHHLHHNAYATALRSAGEATVAQQLDALLKHVAQQPSAYPFMRPVDPVVLGVPDYHAVIEAPMDLGTVEAKLESLQYATPQHVVDDVRLVFRNAQIYNPPAHPVHEAASHLSLLFEKKLQSLLARLKLKLKANDARDVLLNFPLADSETCVDAADTLAAASAAASAAAAAHQRAAAAAAAAQQQQAAARQSGSCSTGAAMDVAATVTDGGAASSTCSEQQREETAQNSEAAAASSGRRPEEDDDEEEEEEGSSAPVADHREEDDADDEADPRRRQREDDGTTTSQSGRKRRQKRPHLPGEDDEPDKAPKTTAASPPQRASTRRRRPPRSLDADDKPGDGAAQARPATTAANSVADAPKRDAGQDASVSSSSSPQTTAAAAAAAHDAAKRPTAQTASSSGASVPRPPASGPLPTTVGAPPAHRRSFPHDEAPPCPRLPVELAASVFKMKDSLFVLYLQPEDAAPTTVSSRGNEEAASEARDDATTATATTHRGRKRRVAYAGGVAPALAAARRDEPHLGAESDAARASDAAFYGSPRLCGDDARVEDPDAGTLISCTLLDSRHTFLEMCQFWHYQFDSLRRAKHSSAMLLYHLHNPKVDSLRILCSHCSREIRRVRWHCSTCVDYNICRDCERIVRAVHSHTLTPYRITFTRRRQLSANG